MVLVRRDLVASVQSLSPSSLATLRIPLSAAHSDPLYLHSILEPIDAVPSTSYPISRIFETVLMTTSLSGIPLWQIPHILAESTLPDECDPLEHSVPLFLLTLFGHIECIFAVLYIPLFCP